MIKKNDEIKIIKAHDDLLYKDYIGKFKKPDIGMYVILKDTVKKYFNEEIDADNTIMIGDTWHDEAAAKDFGIPFIAAPIIHEQKLLE